MKKQKVGLILFWIGVIWSILWGTIGSVSCSLHMNALTMEQLNETVWAFTGPLMILWGVGGVPIGALVAGIGLLLYSDAKGSTIWKFGIAIFLGIIISLGLGAIGHIPPLFGIGGTLILLFFIGILWLWAKERIALKGSSKTATDLKLVGYVFILIAGWFTCGIAGQLFLKAFEGQAPTSPIHIMLFFVLGWLFLFLSHYKSLKQLDSDES